MLKKEKRGMFYKEYGWRGLAIFFGLFVIMLTIVIGAFLVYKGSDTFLKFGHTLWEFLGSAQWEPVDSAQGGGKTGAVQGRATAAEAAILSFFQNRGFSM